MHGPVISLREELIFLLTQATELEHSLSCSYLFTAFSLKSADDPAFTPETAAAVTRWKRVFSRIAVEEMMHLAIVNDVLVAVGAAPNFDRPNFPHMCSYYMPDLHIELQPFNEDLLRHFIAIEQPTGGTLPLAPAPGGPRRVEGARENKIGPDPYELGSQGDVYTLIFSGMRNLADRLGETGLFIGPPATSALSGFLGHDGWEAIRGLDSAERMLGRVVEQGEGGPGATVDSHHEQFVSVLDEYLAIKAVDPAFEPARPVLANPFARTPPEASGGEVNLIDDHFAIQVSDLFNEAYGAMLQILARFFTTTTETEEEAAALGDAAVILMVGTLLPLGELLTRLPAGIGQPGKTAGPSFVVHTMHPLPHKEAAWALIRERCAELRDYTLELATEAPAEQDAVRTAGAGLQQVCARLAA